MLKVSQFFAVILFVFGLSIVRAQEESAADKQSSEALQKSQIESDEDLATKADEARAEYESLAKEAPVEMEKIAQELSSPIPEIDADELSQSTLKTAQEKHAEVTAQLKAAEANAISLANEDRQRALRQNQIPEELAVAKNQLADIKIEPDAEDAENDLDQKRIQGEVAKRKALTSLIARLEAEQATFAVRGELLVQKTRLANRQIADLTKRKEAWQKVYETRKAEETSAATELAKDQADQFSQIPILAKLTKESTKLAREREKVAENMISLSNQEIRINDLRKAVREQQEAAVERLELLEKSGLRIDTKNGGLLRQQRAELPTTTDLTKELHETIRNSTTARIERLELKKRYQDLPLDREAEVRKILESIKDPEISRSKISEVVDQHHTLFGDLLRDYDSYISKLQTLSTGTQLALDEVGLYGRFLDERLLWIPSASVMSANDLQIEIASIKDFSNTVRNEWIPSISKDLRSHWFLWSIILMTVVSLFIGKSFFKKQISTAAIKARQKNCVSIKPTLVALAFTLLQVLPLPLLLSFLAWRGESHLDVRTALSSVAGFLLFVGLFKAMVQKDGVLPAHLKMEPKQAQHLAYHLRWIYPLDPIFLFLATALLINPLYPESGRLSFILLMFFTVIAFHFLFRPSKGLVFAKERSPWKAKALYVVLVMLPVLFALGFGMGYISSVMTLRQQTYGSFWFVLVGIFIGAFLIRWTLVSRRHLARDQAMTKFKREAIERERLRSKKEGAPIEDEPKFEEIEAEVIDVVEVEEQATRLIRLGFVIFIAVGLWNVWQTSLPALSALDKVTLWSSVETSGVKSSPSDVTSTLTGKPQEAETAVEETTPAKRLSLQDLLGSLVIIGLTFVAARNLPGLLELTLLRRLNLRTGGNYAVTTTFRYVIVVIGFLFAFGIIGITWNSVQWLAAAVTLGIGFGLQEIFANFVAGIILLYERPIRVGDIVTVGNDTGEVTKIEIRATTLLQFDCRELVVPNKQFITGELLNWTLSSKKQRFDFNVGITHGSDSREALAILEKLLKDHPDVLEEPAPSVFFVDFAPGSLDFVVRGYVAEPSFLLSTKGELRFRIEEAFEEAGIGISFPQTDRNIRTLHSKNASDRFEPVSENSDQSTSKT